jgi:Holliday junction resolvase-like predicted endonuclease
MVGDTHNQRVGQLGERIAESILVRHGRTVLGRNVRHRIGEVDLVVGWQHQTVAIEVKTLIGAGNPLARIDSLKQRRLRRMTRKQGSRRVEVVAVSLYEEHVEVRWVPMQGKADYW